MHNNPRHCYTCGRALTETETDQAVWARLPDAYFPCSEHLDQARDDALKSESEADYLRAMVAELEMRLRLDCYTPSDRKALDLARRRLATIQGSKGT